MRHPLWLNSGSRTLQCAGCKQAVVGHHVQCGLVGVARAIGVVVSGHIIRFLVKRRGDLVNKFLMLHCVVINTIRGYLRSSTFRVGFVRHPSKEVTIDNV